MRAINLSVFSCVLILAGVAGQAAGRKSMLDDDMYLLRGTGPFNWTCDAPPGKFNQVHAIAAGDHVVVTGNIHIVTMHPNVTYNGVTFVGFYDTKSKRTMALQLLNTHFAPDKISFSFLNGEIGPDTSVLTEQPNRESDFPFTLKLDHGRVSISVAGVTSRSRARPWDSDGLTLACGGAHVEYTNVEIAFPKQVNE